MVKWLRRQTDSGAGLPGFDSQIGSYCNSDFGQRIPDLCTSVASCVNNPWGPCEEI